MTQQKFAFDSFARPLFSSRIAMAWADPRAPMPRLIGDEVLAVEQVSAARAREFAAGRLAARKAMDMLGHIGRPVLQGADLAPVWPNGLIGSITHTDRDSLAAVTDDPDILALGLSLEPATPLEPGLWPVCCTSDEMQWLASLGPSQRGHFAKLILSVKKAVSKAAYASRTRLPELQQITLSIDLVTGRFDARIAPGFVGTGQRSMQSVGGQFAILSDCFIATVEVSRMG